MLRPMFGMGMTEILVILVVALLFLGPEKLPEAAKQLSKGIRDLRKQTREFQDTIESDTQIGGAIRDIKSALRGDELRRPPVRKVPPVDKPKLVAVEPSTELAAAAIAGAAVTDAPAPVVVTESVAVTESAAGAVAVTESKTGSVAVTDGVTVAVTETVSVTVSDSDPDPDLVAAADADPDAADLSPEAAAVDDDLVKLIRPASGAVRRGQPN